MLFNITITRTDSYKKIFGVKKKTISKEYLISAENKQKLAEYYSRLPKEGIDIWMNAYGSKKRPWIEERTWKEIEGDDHDAHVLLLESPTGITYTKQVKDIKKMEITNGIFKI